MERVNKVSVMFEDDNARISLYRTNQKLAECTNTDLGVPPYEESNMPSKTLYINYCRDLTINLLENGGIEGYYYEPKQTSESQKFDKGGFVQAAKKSISEIFNDMQVEFNIKDDAEVEIFGKYKDQYIKDAVGTVVVAIKDGNLIVIRTEIKSGQMCRPKTFTYDGTDYSLNITNINRI